MPDPGPVYPQSDQIRLVSVERDVLRLQRRPANFVIVDHYKVFGDRTTTKVRNPAFAWTVSDDIMDADLDVIGFRAYVTTTGGACSMQLRNLSEDTTLCSATIAAGDRTVYVGTGIDETLNYLEYVGAIADDVPPELGVVTTAGGSTKGLGVYVYYGIDRRP